MYAKYFGETIYINKNIFKFKMIFWYDESKRYY